MAYYYGSMEHTQKMQDLYAEEIKHSVDNSKTFRTAKTVDYCPQSPSLKKIVVEKLTTTEAILKYKDYAALNFASYKYPGGSFGRPTVHLAQEEYLCKDSFLYNVLNDDKFKEDYAWNNNHKNDELYTNWCIFSKDVGFVNDENEMVAKADILTCAAPNASAAQYKRNVVAIDFVMDSRIGFVLAVAAQMGIKNLILGAFGCGVFGNNPSKVATMFMSFLKSHDYGFENVIFAIPGGENYDKFKEVVEDPYWNWLISENS